MKLFARFPVLFLFCAAALGAQGKAPRWVTDKEAAFPNRDWLCVVETGKTKTGAEEAAIASLAQAVRVDVQSLSEARASMAASVQKTGGKAVSQSAEFAGFSREVRAASSVRGLMGVETDFWTAKSGEVHALARMNRAQCAARYRPLIAENERLIALLLKQAAALPGTFDACACLSLAAGAAELTDNYAAILSALRPEEAAARQAYGSAGAVKAREKEAARAITVRVAVRGDVDGRVEKAFAAALSTRGFRAGSGGYTLNVDFRLEDAPQTDGNFVYARFVIGAALRDKKGAEIFAWSENDRQGHATAAEARQRALRKAEDFIEGAGFARAFDAWFASLL